MKRLHNLICGLKPIAFLLCLFVSSNIFAQKKFTVTGDIIQSANQKPLPRSTIYVDETGYGTMSDSAGRYQINLPKGIYNITITYQGFFTKHQKIVINDSFNLDFFMDEKATDLAEVEVSAKNASQNLKRLETGVTNLSIRTLKKLPTLLGELDIIKSLFSLPGVA